MVKNAIRIAVFDIDRTLIVGTSAEIQLIRYLRRKKMLPLLNFIRSLFYILKIFKLGWNEVVIRNRMYLYGLDVKQIDSYIEDFFEQSLRCRISIPLVKRMKTLRKQGFEIILISGSLQFILKFLIDRLNANGGIGTKIETKNGKYTGRMDGLHPYHYGKVKALHQYLNGKTIDFEQSYAFADSLTDVPLLSLFGCPVATNPGKRMRKEAVKRGWEVFEDRTSGI